MGLYPGMNSTLTIIMDLCTAYVHMHRAICIHIVYVYYNNIIQSDMTRIRMWLVTMLAKYKDNRYALAKLLL